MENVEGRELLENVVITTEGADGHQYIRLSENSQIISSELLQNHNGLVVDLAGNDFIPVAYSSEDILTQELTEEDRNLAAALVAVQLSQQQKHQQIQDGTLPPLIAGNKILEESHQQLILTQDKTTGNAQYLKIVNSDNIYIDQQGVHKIVENVRIIDDRGERGEIGHIEHVTTVNESLESDSKIELIDKSFEDDEKSADSDKESIRNDTRSSKKSLPHKKRISRKLKKTTPINAKKFKCSFCTETFLNSDEHQEHEATCNEAKISTTSPFGCQLCNTSFEDQLKFFEHLKKHYEPSGITVENDLPSEETSSNAIAPIIINSNEEKKKKVPTIKQEKKTNDEKEPQETILSSLLGLQCIDCNKTFRRQKTFEAHMRDVHTSKPDPDDFSDSEDMMKGINILVDDDDSVVDDTMETDSKSWYHEDELHQTEKDLEEMEHKDDHICHLCKQPFALRALLLQHLITCRLATGNSDPTPAVIVRKKNRKVKERLNCDLCDRVFKHRNSLVYHMRSHSGIRPHQCELCGKSFFASSALKVHLRLHSGDKPYECEHCGRKFRQWGDLKYHITSIHSTEKNYQCEYCGKEFARKYSLVVHRRIHTGERNYKCEFCSKTFRASSYLQNHRKIHTGEKPHNCSICSKPFRVRSDMKRHEKTHGKVSGPRSTAKIPPPTATTTTTPSTTTTIQTFKVQKDEVIENDESNELHIGEDDDAAEHILGSYEPQEIEMMTTAGLTKRNLYTNGHDLFLVTYPNEIVTRTSSGSTETWIQTSTT